VLGERTWTELAGPRTVVVPIGSVEQHGPHLPLDTDARIAHAVAAGAVHADPGLLLAPTVAYGASGEHEGFPGTVSIGHAALRSMLVELGRSASGWAARAVFVNGHGGNLPSVPQAVAQLRAEGRDAVWFGCGVPGGDAHAGRTETAIVLAIEPSLVRLDAIEPGDPTPLPRLLPALRGEGVRAVSPNGVLGDPTGATAAEGDLLLAGLVAELRERVQRWHPNAAGQLL